MAETTVLRSSAINRTPNQGAKPQAQLSGALPPVHVNMNSGGPPVNNGQSTVRQGVVLLPPKGATRTFQTGGLPNQPAKQGVVISPPKDPRYAALHAAQAVQQQGSALTADQLMLLRHLTDRYLDDQRASAGETPDESTSNNIKLAEGSLVTIDETLAAITAAAAEVAALAAAAAAAPAPRAPAPRAVNVGTRNGQVHSTTAPRRVSRPASPPPPIVVKMEDKTPVIQTDVPPLVAAPAAPTSTSDAQQG